METVKQTEWIVVLFFLKNLFFLQRCLSGHKNIVSYVDSNVSKLNSDVYEVLLLMQYCQGLIFLFEIKWYDTAYFFPMCTG